jgi:hypothetical protein
METALRDAFKVENYSANSHQISFVWKHDQLQVYQQHICGFRSSERNIYLCKKLPLEIYWTNDHDFVEQIPFSKNLESLLLQVGFEVLIKVSTRSTVY